MPAVTIIGKNSYLARRYLETESGRKVVALGHDAVGAMASTNTDCIINFAYPDAYMTDPYDPVNDVDRAIVDRIADTDVHYVMISSRKVYDRTRPCPWDETTALAGQDAYGANKIITEDYVRRHLEGRYTIVRLGNIVESEPGRHTFLGIALAALVGDGRIELNSHPSTKRDFLPAAKFAAAMNRIVGERPVGVYNLASGIGTSIGEVASWVVKGFGAGEVVSTTNAQKDSFLLDVSRLETIIGRICNPDDIREACMESGRLLRDG